MERISLLLSRALTPYQVTVTASGLEQQCRVVLRDSKGAVVLERQVSAHQLSEQRALTDVVDGLHRDLMVAEGRLQPCMIAALRNAAQTASMNSLHA
ncbi:MAG: DUF3509 domain-containing protein [Pseudomonas sp.]|uniref:DUF3509 domain-containing protein n=1 Tax=Pseudomonas abieticivorans TaxID=2931382 RepID=UPI0020BEAF0B|nr:DUF3509 domain-containing protein [Pseudomonas sp. PIA16]MDE1166055.1 DUF3509 domain-containing protein [Pseudomonas sp.]